MPTLVLENEVIFSLTKNKALVDAFPLFKAAIVAGNPAKKGCGGCGSAAPATQALDYAAIKRSIVALPKEAQEKFKQMVGVDKVVLYYKANGFLKKEEF